MTWSAEDLERLDAAHELEIAARRPDGTLRRPTPIWVVCIDVGAFVRTWHDRTTGWYGDATATGHARIAVPGLESDVRVERIGTAHREQIDNAYRTKYGGGGTTGGMTTDESAATTLKLACP